MGRIYLNIAKTLIQSDDYTLNDIADDKSIYRNSLGIISLYQKVKDTIC